MNSLRLLLFVYDSLHINFYKKKYIFLFFIFSYLSKRSLFVLFNILF